MNEERDPNIGIVIVESKYPMPRIFVSIGSNIDKEKNINTAIHELDDSYGPLTLSRVYESRAVGFAGENFYNLVAGFHTDASIRDVLHRLASIEKQCGRHRSGKNHAPRTLDIDLLLYGNLSRHDENIDVPRHEINEYAFVLFPLAEIAPEVKHPDTGITFAQMWRDFYDRDQKLWPVEFDFGR